MAQCKWCGRGGWFVSVDRNGLCTNCARPVLMDIEQWQRIITESIELIQKSKNIKTRLGRCNDATRHLEALLPYERKGIPTLSPNPSELIGTVQAMRNEVILEHIQSEVDKALIKLDVASTLRGKLGPLEKALAVVAEYRPELDDQAQADRIENDLRHRLHRYQFEDMREKATKAEFKGQTKKAIDAYMDALFFLKNDDYDDEEQREIITGLEEKISTRQEQ